MSTTTDPYAVHVRNLKAGPTVFAEGSQVVEWAGRGDPSGDDIQSVPFALTKTSAFAKAVRRKMLEQLADDDPALDRSTYLQMQASNERDKTDGEFMAKTMDPASADLDLIVTKCLISGQDITQKAVDFGNIPPLAPEFAEHVAEFTAVPTGEIDSDGKSAVRWARTIIGEPLPDQQNL